MTVKTVRVRIKDVTLYPNLAPSLGKAVDCTVEELVAGCFMFHVSASTFTEIGCDVGRDNKPFPFYTSEVEEIDDE